MKRRITLASTSSRRSSLLQQIGLEFDVVHSDYQEDMSLNMSPKRMAMHFAEEKALHAAEHLVVGGIVVAADTLVVCRGRRLGKPVTAENAIKMLRFISGRTIKVFSGVCIISLSVNEKKKIVDYEISKVKMKKLSEQEIMAYVNTGEPLDKAGAFAIQGLGAVFVKKIIGCHSNVMGIPLYNIYKNLAKLGTNIFDYKKAYLDA